MAQNCILIFEEEKEVQKVLNKTLGKDFQLDFVTLDQTDQKIEQKKYVLAIVDYQNSGPILLKKIRLKQPTLKVIVLSKEQNLAEVIMAIKMGGTYFLNKPINEQALRNTVGEILEGMTFEILEVFGEYPWYLSTLPKVEELLKMAKNISWHTMDVILCGEPGTGKEALANFIQQNGPSRGRQIATLNLGYYQGEVIETHFWSALREIYQEYENNVPGQEGYIYSTLYIEGLDVKDIYFRLSLLQWLKQKRLEAENKFQLPIRVILGINSPETLNILKEENLKEFVWLNLLPLRERREDIPLLVDYLINKYNQEYNKKVLGITLEALKNLMLYNWPGNIRELQLMIQVVLSRLANTMRQIQNNDLPLSFKFLEETIPIKKFSAVKPLDEAVEEYEKKILEFLLIKKDYDKNNVAEFLGESPENIEDKLIKYNIGLMEGSRVLT